MAGALVELANLATSRAGLTGVNWSALSAAGRGSVWDRDYITNYMVPAQQRMQAVLATLDLDVVMDPVSFKDNYTVNEDIMTDIGQFVVTLGNPIGLLAIKVEARLSRESMRYLTLYAAQSANFGMLLHQDETIHHSGKSDQEIAAHADMVCSIMNAIYLLNAADLYSMLGVTKSSSDQPTSGLGLTPAVVVIIIAVAALIAYIIVHMYDVNQINNVVSSMCKKAQADGDAATTQQCVNTLTAASKDLGTLIPPGTFEGILKTVLPYALAGVGVYMLFLFAPAIVKSITTSHSSA